jgi:hypothetical protein
MNTVIGVHIATFSAGTLAHVVTTLGIRWEVFNTSGKRDTHIILPAFHTENNNNLNCAQNQRFIYIYKTVYIYIYALQPRI